MSHRLLTYSLGLFLLFVGTLGFGQPSISITAPVSIVDEAIREVDLRDIEVGDDLQVKFNLLNRSASVLKIVESDLGCSCVSADGLDQVIMPDSATPLGINFKMTGRSGPWTNTISLKFTSDEGTEYFGHWQFLFDLKKTVLVVDSKSGSVGNLQLTEEGGGLTEEFHAKVSGFPKNLPEKSSLSFLSPVVDDQGSSYQVSIVRDEWERDGYVSISLSRIEAEGSSAADLRSSILLLPVVVDSPVLESPIVRRVPLSLIRLQPGSSEASWTTLRLKGFKGKGTPTLYIMPPVSKTSGAPIPTFQFSRTKKGFDERSLRESRDVIRLESVSREKSSLLFNAPGRLPLPFLLFLSDAENGPHLPVIVSGEADRDGTIEWMIPETVDLSLLLPAASSIPSKLDELTFQFYYPSSRSNRIVAPTGEVFILLAAWNIPIEKGSIPSFSNCYIGAPGRASFRLFGPNPPSIRASRLVWQTDVSFQESELPASSGRHSISLIPVEAELESGRKE